MSVEVLHGNPSEPGQTRRREDRRPSDRRTLDWSSRPCDILLRPQSPLALADVLSHSNGCFDLVAHTEAETQVADKALDSKRQARRHRHRSRENRERANLLTRHDADELYQRCRRILVESALVKVRGQKRLYLTAGFLRWQDGKSTEHGLRSPLLFYPALLVRKETNSDNSSVEHPIYEVRLEGAVPDINPELADRCKALADIDLPEFEPQAPLPDYFAQVAERVADSDHVSLEFEIALGTAAPPLADANGYRTLLDFPELPTHFDAALAMSVAGKQDLDGLTAVLNLLQDYASEPPTPPGSIEAASSHTASVATLREYSAKLAAQGLEHTTFDQLTGLSERLAQCHTAIRPALDSKLLTELLQRPDLSVGHLVRLSGIIELIDKAPLNFDQYRHPDLAFASTPALLRRARHQARLIEEELQALQEHFLLDKVPSKKQLLTLIEELGGNFGTLEPDVVDADYFSARRQFMEFSVQKPAQLNQDHQRLLGQLAKVLRFRELFVNNTEYRQSLGPGYRGLRTDWAALERMQEYAREYSEVLGSESLAAQLLKNWQSFKDLYVRELDVLQLGGEALRKLLSVLGKHWAVRTVSDLLQHSERLSKQLQHWEQTYGSMQGHGSRSPASLLSQFSGQSAQDVLIEAIVSDTQTRINEQLVRGEIERIAVAETLAWMRTACERALDQELRVEDILGHVQLS